MFVFYSNQVPDNSRYKENTKNYKDAVLKAVNLGDDTDTVGALTGALAGLIYGINDIPTNWLNRLQRKDYLDEMVNKYL